MLCHFPAVTKAPGRPDSLGLALELCLYCRCRYRARVEKVESPAKVHVFYIDYGNVSVGDQESGRVGKEGAPGGLPGSFSAIVPCVKSL